MGSRCKIWACTIAVFIFLGMWELNGDPKTGEMWALVIGTLSDLVAIGFSISGRSFTWNLF